jgi:hypothetical protein
MLLQKLALYFTLGLLLTTLGLTVTSWQFWCITALFWASEYMTRKDTEQTAMAMGISAYLNMSIEEQNRIKKVHQDAMKEQDNG